MQIGASCWLLLAGIGVAAQSIELSILLVVCFLIPNIAGTVMWMRKSRIPPHKAYQYLICILLLSTAVALIGADYLGFLGALDQRFRNPRNLYWLLMLFPVLMALLFYANGKRVG